MKLSNSINKSRLAVLGAFFTNGALFATRVSRIPELQKTLNLSEGALGLILFGLSAGSLTALSLAGGLTERFGSQKTTITGAFVMCICLPLLALATHPVSLFIDFFIFGAAMSVMDVAMNEQAILVEKNTGRPMMSSFHAAYSVGGLVGALAGAGIVSLHQISIFLHFIIAAVFFCALMIFAYPHLLPSLSRSEKKSSVFQLPERAIWGLGVIAFCSVLAEGAMADWSGVYFTLVLGTSASFAPLGYAAFLMTMTIARIFGDLLLLKWKPNMIVKIGGFLSSLGLLAVAFSNNPYITLTGFALVGSGLANIVPLTFGAAGKQREIPTGSGIAGVVTFGYAGMLAGPPFIGFVAEHTSLRAAIFMIAVLVGSLLFSAKALSSQTE